MIRNNLDAKRRASFFVFDNFIGESEWSRQLRRRVVQSSSHRFNAIVTGPAGSGKRLIARSLHEHGPRRLRPFIPVDCATLPAELFRSQLFGQVYRETTTLGGFRAADGGTLYLANVDCLDTTSQLDLLEVLETKTLMPYGSVDRYSVDVRIVAGARRKLDHEVREGRFHADLFRRLGVLSFETTPLTLRPMDIGPIAKHLVAKLTFERGLPDKQLTRDAVQLLKIYDWPGNVTELREVIDEAIHFSKFGEINAADLSIELCEHRAQWSTLADLEAKHIRDTLAISCGDVAKAAALLGINKDELQAKLSPRKD